MKKNKNLIIFDFDGVLADTFDTFYPLIKNSMNHIGLPFKPDQYRKLFIGNVHQGFKDFINNEETYLIFKEFRSANYDKYYYDKKTKAKLFPETTEFVKKILKQAQKNRKQGKASPVFDNADDAVQYLKQQGI